MEPTKLFEIFEEVAHAEQRPGEMVSRYATVKIRDLLHRAQNGDDKAKHELVGQCMRQSGGKLNPALVRQYIDNMEALVKAAEKEHETNELIQL